MQSSWFLGKKTPRLRGRNATMCRPQLAQMWRFFVARGISRPALFLAERRAAYL
jgi:hypothetical protein